MSTPGATSSSPPAMFSRSRWMVFTWILALAVGAGLAGVSWMAVRQALETSSRNACRANLKQIGAALHAYHDQYGSFPPAFLAGEDGKPLHSWRVLLLPFLGEEELYRQYHFNEPWDGPSNRVLAMKIPAVYACPAGRTRNGVTNYFAIVGRATAWPEEHSARLADFVDGASSTIQLLEFPDSDVLWLEPRDRSHREFTRPEGRSPLPAAHNRDGGAIVNCLLADGSVRPISSKLNWDTFKAMLTLHGGRPLAGVDWPTPTFGLEKLPPVRPSGEFAATDVIPCPTLPIVDRRNCVYCATFELAWGHLNRTLGHGSGGEVALSGTPDLADKLNRHAFDRRNLSEQSYVAFAGPGTEAAREQLRADIERNFAGAAPGLLDRITGDRELLMYAYLLKALPFETEFDSLAKPLLFQMPDGPSPVASFGIEKFDGGDARGKQLQSQVAILDYVSNDDFILRLKPVGSQDQIVLAKVAPGATLEETTTEVQRRISHPDPRHTVRQIVYTEPLIIPKLAIGVERSFSEITGRAITGTDLELVLAMQVIRFRLDETGAVLESEAAIVSDFGESAPPGKRKFIFDQPFLVYLIEREATQPYFAMWVANPEVMEPLAP